LEWTRKLSDEKIFKLDLKNSYRKDDQIFELDNSFQEVNQKQFNFQGTANFIGKGSTFKNYSVKLGYEKSLDQLQSRLQIDEAFLDLQDAVNEVDYSLDRIFNESSISFKVGKISIIPSYKLDLVFQKYLQDSKDEPNAVYFNPKLNLRYRLNKNESFNLISNRSFAPPTISTLYKNPILLSKRLLISNAPYLDFFPTNSASLSYSKYDLFNQTQFNAELNYQIEEGGYLNEISISRDFTMIENIFIDESTRTFEAGIYYSKYIQFLETTSGLRLNYTNSEFYNYVNGSTLNLNKTNRLILNNDLRTAFDGIVNFDNNFLFLAEFIESQAIDTRGQNLTIKNKFTMKIDPLKDFHFDIACSYFNPDLSSDNSILFFDSKLNYFPAGSNIQFGINMTNITNQKFYEQVQIGDFSEISINSLLLGQQILLSLNWSI